MRHRRHEAGPKTKMWRSSALGAAQLLSGSFAGYAYDPHAHESACFALITDGAIRIRVRGREFVARKGDIFAMEADGIHAGWPVDARGWKQRTLYVQHEQLAGVIAGEQPRLPDAAIADPLIRDAELARIFLRMHRYSERHGWLLECEEEYMRFAMRVFHRHMREPADAPRAGREDNAVRLVRSFLEANLTTQKRLADLAQMAGVPSLRLFRAFTRALGMPPHAWQRQARIRYAARLIREGERISQAAAAAGFADQAHMTRIFRRSLGVTPGAYRAAFL